MGSTISKQAGLIDRVTPVWSKRSRRVASFTLIEVLVAVAVSTIVVLGVETAFVQGRRIWLHAEGRSHGLERLTAIIAALREELSGLYLPVVEKTKPIEYAQTETGESKLAFFTTTPGLYDREVRQRTVRVVYEHRLRADDTAPSVLIRREQLYSGEKPIAESTAEVVAVGLSGFSVSFYARTSNGKEGYWDPEPPSKGTPPAIRLQLTLEGKDDEAVRQEPASLTAILVVPCQMTIAPPENDDDSQPAPES